MKYIKLIITFYLLLISQITYSKTTSYETFNCSFNNHPFVLNLTNTIHEQVLLKRGVTFTPTPNKFANPNIKGFYAVLKYGKLPTGIIPLHNEELINMGISQTELNDFINKTLQMQPVKINGLGTIKVGERGVSLTASSLAQAAEPTEQCQVAQNCATIVNFFSASSVGGYDEEIVINKVNKTAYLKYSVEEEICYEEQVGPDEYEYICEYDDDVYYGDNINIENGQTYTATVGEFSATFTIGNLSLCPRNTNYCNLKSYSDCN